MYDFLMGSKLAVADGETPLIPAKFGDAALCRERERVR